MRSFRHGAQSLIEYVALISIVTMALTVMFPMVKRAVQSVVKTGADQIGKGNPPVVQAGYTTSTRTNVVVDSRPRTQQGSGQVWVIEDGNVSSKSLTDSIMQ